jgi:hypothetical protein
LSFLLRILFSGLTVFIPSQDGHEVTVLLLNVGHSYHTSDGASLAHHKPLLIARAGSCSGDCPTRDSAVARFIYEDKSVSEAQDALEEAVGGGAAWALAGSDLSLHKGSSTDPDLPELSFRTNVRGTVGGQPLPIPTTSTEREDYSWLANLKEVCPTDCTIDPAVLATTPSSIVAARFHLRSGTVFTYAIERLGANVTPVQFKRLDGSGSASSYSQAVASWIGADVTINASNVQIVEDKFDATAGRSMTLSPDENGKVEMAVLNLPPFVPPASPINDAPQVGKHFEAYYEVSETPQASETRLVPYPGAAPSVGSYPEVAWSDVHPTTALWSELLNKLRLNVGRTMYDRTVCPPAGDPKP